ncbi:MAG: hypothetical protein K8F36_02760 [Melioribacteraceae bacterium]|nr:hypothetical protein [Melioribacteraceae bacterium]
MKVKIILIYALLIFAPLLSCDDDSSTNSTEGAFGLLTNGTWVVTENTEIGIPGVLLVYNTNYQADRFINNQWYYANFNWHLENNDTRLVLENNYDGLIYPYDIEILTATDMVLIARDNIDYGKREIWRKM